MGTVLNKAGPTTASEDSCSESAQSSQCSDTTDSQGIARKVNQHYKEISKALNPIELMLKETSSLISTKDQLYSKIPNLLMKNHATYRIAGKFGGELNLAVWRSIITTAKLKSAKISYSHIYVWRSRTEPPNLNPPIFFQ